MLSRSPLTGRWRGWAVTPGRFVRVAALSLFAMFVVVTSGAFVRLTASGLGCDNWPRCGDKPYPEKGYHAFVEFGNRIAALVGIMITLVAWLAARRTRGLSTAGRRAALGALLGAVGQIPLGGITVILELHPVAVMLHFFLSFLVVACAVVALVEASGLASGQGDAVGPRWWRLLAVAGVGACAVLIVTGAVATAAGPHSGGEDIRRLGIPVNDAVYVHVRAAAVFGVGFLIAGAWLVRHRALAPGVARLGVLLFGVLVAQMVLGEIQYRNAIPWELVLAHVFLSAAIWTLTVGLVYVLWRPPLPLLRTRARTAPAPGTRADVPAG